LGLVEKANRSFRIVDNTDTGYRADILVGKADSESLPNIARVLGCGSLRAQRLSDLSEIGFLNSTSKGMIRRLAARYSRSPGTHSQRSAENGTILASGKRQFSISVRTQTPEVHELRSAPEKTPANKSTRNISTYGPEVFHQFASGARPPLHWGEFLGVIYHIPRNDWVFEYFPNFVLAS